LLESQISNNVGSLIDGKMFTNYVNNYAIGAGFTVESNYHTPVKEIEICPSLDCVECDPTCYKIEGMCEGDEEWVFIQAGNLDLNTADRNECQVVEIKGRHQYTMLKVTFPCQRGGWEACEDPSSCLNYPLKVSEIDLRARCKDLDLEPLGPGNKAPAPPVCKSLGEECVEDCDCCGYKNPFAEQSLRCEQRNEPLGHRCYKCVALADTCSKNSECCSQKCVDDICVPNAEAGRPKWCLKSLFSSYSLFESVSGMVTQEEGLCPCTDLKDSQISSGLGNLIDDEADTDYVNNYPLSAGFLLSSNYHAPLREFKVCPSESGSPASVPTCYKIEGKCDGDKRYTLVQEGELDIIHHTCVTVPITGRHEYTQYKVTFPCLRGGFDACEDATSCQNYPLMVSEVDLLAKCEQGEMAQM